MSWNEDFAAVVSTLGLAVCFAAPSVTYSFSTRTPELTRKSISKANRASSRMSAPSVPGANAGAAGRTGVPARPGCQDFAHRMVSAEPSGPGFESALDVGTVSDPGPTQRIDAKPIQSTGHCILLNWFSRLIGQHRR
jgi:hypothetical protein